MARLAQRLEVTPENAGDVPVVADDVVDVDRPNQGDLRSFCRKAGSAQEAAAPSN